MWIKIEKALKKKGISIYKLSKLTGIPKTTIENYKYKHTNISFINACKMVDALNISLDDIRGDTECN